VLERKRGTVRALRRENRAAVLWSLYFSQPGTRQDLSAATGLSPASVTNVVRELLNEGIVIEAGSIDSDGGRPRVMLEVNPDHGYVVGVDIGETRIRVEIFDLTMRERAKAEYALNPGEHHFDVVVEGVLSGLNSVLAESGIESAAILGMGVGVPGYVERRPEAVVHSQTYGWEAVPLERLLRAGTDIPLHIENGAMTMGQAELWFGAGKGMKNAVVALIGSGVGVSLISSGTTYQGATSTAAEWGHIKIMVDGRKCRCGSAGCLEAYVGAEAILERYGRPAAGPDEESALAALVDAADTAPLAAAILDETAEYLGAGIASLINLFSPERVILGGWAGLLLGRRLLPAIRESARRNSLRHLYAATSLELGDLGPEAVALGAATLPVEAFLNGSARLLFFCSPQLAQPAGGELGAAVAGEHALEVERLRPVVRLRRGEVGERPDVGARDEVPFRCHRDEPLDELSLVFLGPHGGRIGVRAGNGVSPEFGQDDGLAPALVRAIERLAEHGLGDIEFARMRIPAGIAVEEDDIGGIDPRRARQVRPVSDRARPVERTRRVA
jgi:predicted NBD/HSP70 family sugar kinase